MTTNLNIGQTILAAVQFYDGSPDGDGNPTGSEIILDHAATWGSSPSGKLTITPITNQSAQITGIAVNADVTVTATDTDSGISATVHITVPAVDVPVPPDPPFPISLPELETPDPGPDMPVGAGGTGSNEGTQNDEWWGPQDPLIPIFPLHPSLGYTPVVPAPSNPPPLFAQWGFDNGFIGYIRNS